MQTINPRISAATAAVIVGIVFSAVFIFAPETEAQSRSEWRERLRQTSEGEGIDEDDIRSWRGNSQIRDRIEDLDNDAVEDLPIPLLFGVSIRNITPNFGDSRAGGDRVHEGLDIIGVSGVPVVTPTEAVVIRIGDGDSSGKYVTTANPGDETFVYMHLDEIADIDEGDELEVGDIIGYVGNTGNASGGAAHLHFEIREDRDPTDPYFRVTKEFSLEQKIDFLEAIFRQTDDETEFAEFLVRNFRNDFLEARASGLDLPDEILDVLAQGGTQTVGGIPTSDLTLGSRGPAVVALQTRLIAEGFLKVSPPTDYFGPLTQAALIAFQRAKGIQPADGYYGPLTRTKMGVVASTGGTVPTTMTRAELTARVRELTKLLEELQATLARQQSLR